MDTIKLDRKLSRPPQEVWITLFSKNARRVWWGDRVQLHPEENSRFREYWRDADGRDRLSKGRILALEENRLVRISWKDDDWPEYTEVVITLTAEDNGTKLELVHDGFIKLGPKLHFNVEEYLHGWEALLDDLNIYLTTGGKELEELLKRGLADDGCAFNEEEFEGSTEGGLNFDDFLKRLRERLERARNVDADEFRAKVEEVAAELGWGAWVAKEKVADWTSRAKKAWPEVEQGLISIGKGFLESITAFGKAFREGYQDKKPEESKDKE